MESDGDHFLTYYLTKDDDAAEEFKESRADLRGIDSLQEEEEVGPYPFISLPLIHIPHQQATEFHFVRDYEVVKVEQEVPNEFLLVFDNGDLTSSITNGLNDDETRHAGAYYKMIERKMLLKKKRTEVRCRRRLFSYWLYLAYNVCFSRSSASATSGLSCASRMCRRATMKPKSAARHSRRYATQCTCYIQPMQKAKTISTRTARVMQTRMEKASWSSVRRGNYSMYTILLYHVFLLLPMVQLVFFGDLPPFSYMMSDRAMGVDSV
jgi:hypothetical protein